MKIVEKYRLIVACVSTSILTAIGTQPFLGKAAYAQSDILRTSQLEVVDKEGRVRGGLVYRDNPSGAYFYLKDSNGQTRISMHARNDTPHIGILDSNGKVQLTLAVSSDDAATIGFGENANLSMGAFRDGTAGISFADKNGHVRGEIATTKDGLFNFVILRKDQTNKLVGMWP